MWTLHRVCLASNESFSKELCALSVKKNRAFEANTSAQVAKHHTSSYTSFVAKQRYNRSAASSVAKIVSISVIP